MATKKYFRLRDYRIIAEAIETGVRWGLQRSRKHTDTPSDEQIIECIVNEIFLALDEVVHWEDE